MTAYAVRGHVAHRRTRPFDYGFEHRTTAWLVDAADPNAAFPRWLRPLMSIRGEDHLDAGEGPLRDKLVAWLRGHEVPWTAQTVQALVNARTVGHVFNPLTTYFCFDADGRLEGILAEVHNTHGERHCYPLPAESSHPDADFAPSRRNVERRAGTQPSAIKTVAEKTFYVSPFFTVEGRYDIRTRMTDDHVAVAITLSQDDIEVFTGSIHGALVPATRRAVVRAFLRDPFASQRVTALIRWHGIRLWLRRLPVVPHTPKSLPKEASS